LKIRAGVDPHPWASYEDRMRRLVVVLCFAIFACSKPKETAPVEAKAPVQPGTPMHLDKPDEARVALDLAAARAAIQQKTQVDGAAPKSIADFGVRLNFPNDLIYDPATGEVKSRTYPQK
jgi:hypothetical protein